MYGRVTAMGLGIVAPKIAIASLTLKLCLSHKNMNSENGKFLKTIEDNETTETGLKGGRSGSNKMEESGPRMWIEGARKFLEDRRAKIENEENEKITNDKTIMEHALEYAKEK